MCTTGDNVKLQFPSAMCVQAMGFFDQQANIRALQSTGGNVDAALDLLFQNI